MISRRNSDHVFIIGKRSMKDYVGARSYHLFKVIDSAGIKCTVYDLDSKTPDPPHTITHVVYLGWIQYLDADLLTLIERLPGEKYLWTEQFGWYEECREKGIGTHGIDPESVFDYTCFSSPEGMGSHSLGVMSHRARKHLLWNPLAFEGLCERRDRSDTVFVDSRWPEEWASGVYNAWDIISAEMPGLREKLGVRVVTQPAPDGSVPEWADEVIPSWSDVNTVLRAYASSLCYITTHHELLGQAIVEAQVCGTPVVCASEHACESVRYADGLSLWKMSQEEKAAERDHIDPLGRFEQECETIFTPQEDLSLAPGQRFCAAVESAVSAGRDLRASAEIRDRASKVFGSSAFWNNAGEKMLGAKI